MSQTEQSPTVVTTLPEKYYGNITNGQINCCVHLYQVRVSGCASGSCFAYEINKKGFMYKCPYFTKILQDGTLPCFKLGKKL